MTETDGSPQHTTPATTDIEQQAETAVPMNPPRLPEPAPKLARGVRWSDVLADIEQEQELRDAA